MKMPNNIDDLVSAYKVTKSGHFFDENTMEFFKSKLTPYFVRLSDKEALFITTEKRCFEDPRRVASVRRAKINGDKINISTEKHQVTLFMAKKHLSIMQKLEQKND